MLRKILFIILLNSGFLIFGQAKALGAIQFCSFWEPDQVFKSDSVVKVISLSEIHSIQANRKTTLYKPAFLQDYVPYFTAGYISQGEAKGGELGVVFKKDYYNDNLTYWGENNVFLDAAIIGVEVLAGGDKNLLVAPKVSYEICRYIIGGKADLAYYFSTSGRQSLRFTPQAGLCIGGTLLCFYGYSLPITNNLAEHALGNHRLYFAVNFIPLLSRWK